ncbi:hypothetical protein MLD38_015417 [Melastoma candidum]|uniref:Uncharacterized protein n=1 Tax=Melastoma candidum TaxID=119954 RepID=A0ACB9RG52_9MYRT|nr:hypothetical protein MLD38_015417 [Melastoma candidum]
MDRLRPRRRQSFSGFVNGESAGHAGKPTIKWDEIQSWFRKRKEEGPGIVPSSGSPKNDVVMPGASNNANDDLNTPEAKSYRGCYCYFPS